ncbi:HAMP domain-containing sensor histidine kinase [Haliscomenobacter hydrossis]|uniref:histidine kinase n=1 Tax=Haliscomenobacter hydrossis (strain ATCC 27775 / DSM 1100 / LMG 10767 / O) TaxID=760192 RepID=F4L6D8_HALH1|nr:HAMP domain-containing sensor histidine kinase [Haliscomenobacter hydrossis]AEE48820.1 integral membrane sensor signal transduction histidine kinase [Haliscomenobacter hydrossis DSM 1100]
MRFWQLNIRQRLTIFISISSFLILLLEGFFIYNHMVKFCKKEFKSRIKQRLAEADSLIIRDPNYPFTAIGNLPPGSLPEEKFAYTKESNQILLPNGDHQSSAIDTLKQKHCTYCFLRLNQRDYGILYDSTNHHTLILSAYDRYGQSKLRSLRHGIIVGILIGVILLSLVSWFWLTKFLQPISAKIQKARTIGTHNLNLRLEVKNSHDELGQLALTFNEMLDRIEAGFLFQQQFIRNASHEIRTPLTAITAEVDLALQKNRNPEKYQHALENIRQRAGQLNELVTQLLLLAKVEANTTINQQLCAADEILLFVVKNLQFKYVQIKEILSLKLEAADSTQFQVYCDHILLQAAFYNLLDNALKYGNNKPVVTRLFRSNNLLCLEIIDRGIGIDPKELEHLFEPFYRINRLNHPLGSGIGLSLVKSIAERFGGSIQLTSQLGQGTTVLFSLPSAIQD